MSEENVELARRGFEAFARGGRDAVVELLDPEIELWLPSGLIQAGGTYRGHEAVLGWMKEWAEAWEEIEYKPEESSNPMTPSSSASSTTGAARGAG
jgi:ketosteroid isomerase-like protein